MKKHTKRKPIKATAPMLASRYIANTELELKERMAVTAFSAGFANTQHFDTLLAMTNLMLIAGEERPAMKSYAEKIKAVLENIRIRFQATGKLGVNATELKALREMVDASKAFWNGQSTGYFNECVNELNAYYDELQREREAA
jgi:uncharacterized protein YukE